MKKQLLILCFLLVGFQYSWSQCVSTCSNYAMSPITFSVFPNGGTNVIPMFAPSIDDGITTPLPIGFNFNYYCTTYSTVLICSNGFIQFDIGSPPNLAFSNPAQVFPDVTSPNGIVALNMGDFDPNMGGTITYNTIGVSPNRMFIVTYSNVPMWNYNTSLNTGQIVLYETSNIIEIHTGAVNTSQTSFYPGTQGIENELGTMGLNVPGRVNSTWTATNSAYQFSPYTPTPPNSITGNTLLCQGTLGNYVANFIPSAQYYSWYLPPGWTGTSTTVAMNATAGVSGNFSVTATYTCGTSAPFQFAVTTIPAPLVNITSVQPFQVCSGQQFTIYASGATSYSLEPGGITGTPPFAVLGTASAIYSLTGANSSGCVSANTATTAITVLTTPTVSVNSGSICSGQSFTMNPSGASSYTFFNGFPVVTPPVGVNSYSVAGSSTAGCTGAIAVSQVTVVALPNVTASATRSVICLKESVVLTAGGATTYSWNTSATTSTVAVSPTTTTTYTVYGNMNGCSSSTTITEFVSLCLGLTQSSFDEIQVQVFPNPNRGEFSVATPIDSEPLYLEVNNSLGQLIYKETLRSEMTRINLTGISDGVYYLKVSSEKQQNTSKLIISSK